MSSADAKAAAYERAVQYLEQTLRLNPLNDSATIVRRRSRLLGLEAKAATSGIAPAAGPARNLGAERQKLLGMVEKIRAGFWTTPLPTLKASVAALSADDFPDIQSVVERLTTVASHRDQIPRLVSNKGFDADFFSVFKEVIVASPRDSAIVKERTLAAFGNAKLRRRGARMIALIERELPYLYELESQWMKSLVRQRNRKVKAAPAESHFVAPASSGFSIPWWAVFVGLAVVRALIKLAGE